MPARAFYSSSIKKIKNHSPRISHHFYPPLLKNPKKPTTMHNFDEYPRQGEPDKAEKAKP